MEYETPAFNDTIVNNVTDDTGIIDDQSALTLDTPDRELIGNFKRWIADAKTFWNDREGYNLERARNKNERYYLGKQIDIYKFYDHQTPYVDNEIFVGVQAITAYVSANSPACEIIPENDQPQSVVMAQELETAINTHTERHQFNKKVKAAVKDLFINRVGCIKLKWDDIQKDVVPIVVDPRRLILDKDCRLGEEPKFICEVCTDTAATLFRKFPDKEKEIMRALGWQRKSTGRMNQTVAYNEIWFTDFTAAPGEQECVAWYLEDVVLGKMKNPNYLYDKEGVSITNFMDYPTKPYVFFNYLNDGTSLIDQTTATEQAIPLQDILNKRGQQIVDNADTANSMLVLKSGSVSEDNAANIVRAPNQALLLDSGPEQPVSSAFGEISPHLLPAYVIEDRDNVKNLIHNILGTPSQFRGDDSKREVGTLGEAKMIQSQASGRQDEIVREIENSLDRYFRLLVQMMKVYYDEAKNFATRDSDGKFVYVELSRESMPNVASISVSHGSLIRTDRERRENIAMTLAKLGVIDPYNLFKDLSLTDANKRYEALVKFKMDPSSLVSDVRSEIDDKEAYIDFAIIMNGQEPKPRDNVQPGYIRAIRELLMTDQFLYAKPDRQQALIDYIENVVIGIRNRAKLEADDQQGLLLDPNIPITPEPPEVPPPMPQPPMMPPQGMPPNSGPVPPVPDAGAMSPQGEAPIPQMPDGAPDVGILNGLMGA